MGRVVTVGGRRIDVDAQLILLDAVDCESSLYCFLRSAWRYIDPSPWIDGWPIEAVAEHLQAVIDGDIRRLIINLPPRLGKSSCVSVALPAWTWAQPDVTPTSGPQVPFLHASYAESLSLRDSVKCRRLIESPWYQARWGHRFQLNSDQNTKRRFGNYKHGERLITSIGGGTTGEWAMVICIDDPNAANEAFSEATIQTTIDWWDQTMSTRLNDPKRGAYIIIQQRLAEDDLSGHVLEKNIGEWTHLMLPMRFEKSRSFVTVIGWQDPRTADGELLWPERFDEKSVKSLESALGPFGCTPQESPVLMADLTMKRIADVVAGDNVIGFRKRDRDGGRFALERAKVLETHKYHAEVVKVTLDSGHVIRCTRDHKWFTKGRGVDREMYMPATTRSRLARVCPPRLPELTPQEERDAGWLSGFFDGEGSVSACKRPEYEPSSIISFYQGAGRNLPLCEKLEALLAHFGFEYTYSEDERKPNKSAPCYGYRNYRLNYGRSGNLTTVQRFLHIVQPTKWRQRLLDGVLRSNFITGRERVVSIEPDGVEDVYALTTTTGNYVVWGLASSNSAGQLQQRPEPAGGGIIKRDWWIQWDDPQFPMVDFVLAVVDTAYTEDTVNDPSAMTVWGVFTGDNVNQASRVLDQSGRPMFAARVEAEGAPKVMLMYAWSERLELHDLVVKVAKTAKDFKIDRLRIENKASGISVAQEIRRLYADEAFSVQLADPKSQDKLSRLYSVQHLFAEGMVYAPDRPWAEAVITQVGQFPRGKHDDLVDTVSAALRHLRDIGLLTRGDERLREIEGQRTYPGGQSPPLYPGM